MTCKNSLPQSTCARRLRVLADANRLSVLELLLDGPKHVWELNAYLGLEQSLLSHHLKVLRTEGFVESTRNGKAVLYQLALAVQSSSAKAIHLGCCVLTFE
jgi:DNA-binding transcriptional ArsR family regulator